MRALRVALTVPALALGLAPASVSADSVTPVRLKITIAHEARLHRPLTVTVQVNADAGVLDIRDGPLYARVRLTTRTCGSEFEATGGTVLLDRPLKPQPDPGEAYQGRARGSGRPTRRGVQHVCVFLEDRGADRLFASDTTDYRVKVA